MNIYKLIGEGKIKRYLRSRKKLNYAGLVSHITQHAAGRDPLFLEDADYLYFLKLLKEIAEKFQLSIFCFCLMTNHVHILLRQAGKNLPEAMHDLFLRYAKYFNKKYARKGHLFSGAFRQAACFDDYYLLSSSLYIHLNPVRAGIVGRYSNYRWSTWRLYCQDGTPDTFVDWRFILRLIHGNVTAAKKIYIELLLKSSRHRGPEVQNVKTALGKFSVWVRHRFPSLITASAEGDDEIALPDGYAADSELETAVNLLRGKKRLTRPSDIKARRFAVEQLLARSFTVQEIADYLEISRYTIYNILR